MKYDYRQDLEDECRGLAVVAIAALAIIVLNYLIAYTLAPFVASVLETAIGFVLCGILLVFG